MLQSLRHVRNRGGIVYMKLFAAGRAVRIVGMPYRLAVATLGPLDPMMGLVFGVGFGWL